jgi:hypothetical protein
MSELIINGELLHAGTVDDIIFIFCSGILSHSSTSSTISMLEAPFGQVVYGDPVTLTNPSLTVVQNQK